MNDSDHTILGGAALVTGSLFLAFAFITVLDMQYLFTATVPLVVVGAALLFFSRNALSKADNDEDTPTTKTRGIHVGENRKQRREREKREAKASRYG